MDLLFNDMHPYFVTCSSQKSVTMLTGRVLVTKCLPYRVLVVQACPKEGSMGMNALDAAWSWMPGDCRPSQSYSGAAGTCSNAESSILELKPHEFVKLAHSGPGRLAMEFKLFPGSLLSVSGGFDHITHEDSRGMVY